MEKLVTITDRDIIGGYLRDQSGLAGYADYLVRPTSSAEVREVVNQCRDRGTPLLPIGLQSSTTGASVPRGGLVLDTTGLRGVVDVDPVARTAEVLPGTLVGDLKAAAAEAGLLYPPDPTSEFESTIGGNVATNASGARSFRWGMTGRWIRGLEVVDGAGVLHRLSRRSADKSSAGPAAFKEPLDLLVGSEGIFGVLTRVWVDLIPDTGPFFGCFLYFRQLNQALAAAVSFRTNYSGPGPRCVELFDREALDIIESSPRAIVGPREAGAMLFVEWDSGEREPEQVLDRLMPDLEAMQVLLDQVVVARTRDQIARMRELRHRVPETCNQRAARFREQGGRRVSTDFCVPPERLLEMMARVEEVRQGLGDIPMVRYGHIGNGHPHVFMMGRTREEVGRLERDAERLCRAAVALGGVVAGEHGIGKLKRHLLGLQLPGPSIASLIQVKKVWDPGGILAPGNIIPGDDEPISNSAGGC